MHQSSGLRRETRRPGQAHRRQTGLSYTGKSFEEIRSHFVKQRRLEYGGHTDPSWRGTHTVSAAFIIPVEVGPLRERLAPIREAVDDFDFVSLHPDDFMHLTLALIGFLQESDLPEDQTVSMERLEELSILARAALAGFGEISFRLDNLNAFPGAAFIEVHDSGGIKRLEEALSQACDLKRVVWPPHLTIAYFHVPDGSPAPDELVSVIERFADWPVGEVTVREVELSLLNLDTDYPTIQTFDKIPLSGRSRSAAPRAESSE